MSEIAPRPQETGSEKRIENGHEKRLQAHHEAEAAKAAYEQRRRQENLDVIRQSIDNKAEKAETFRIDKFENSSEERPHLVSAELRQHSLNQSLHNVRRNLSKPEQEFSKFIHNQKVDNVSEVAANTIARPNGLLYGGIFSLLTNLGVVAVCRYYGYEYNYLLGLVAFTVGFCAGLIIEAILRKKHPS